MKKEYDFSKGERGKFYNENANLNLPIYLEPDVDSFFRGKAKEKNKDTQTLINEMLRREIQNIQSVS